MTLNLLISTGYVAFSGLTQIGDAAECIAGLHPPLVWRGLLIFGGLLLYFASMQAAAIEFRRFCGLGGDGKRLFRLVWIPYVATGCLDAFTSAV